LLKKQRRKERRQAVAKERDKQLEEGIVLIHSYTYTSLPSAELFDILGLLQQSFVLTFFRFCICVSYLLCIYITVY